MSKLEVPKIEEPKKRKISLLKNDIVGAVNYSIGTGKNAQDSVVWLTIKWSFILGITLSLLLIIFMWPSEPDGTHPPIKIIFPIEQLKTIWSIFIPIVTLALGYMFGKGR